MLKVSTELATALELKSGVLGVGNMGGQCATIAARDYDIPSIAVNSSLRDLNMVEVATTILFGEMGRGTGKNRNLAKEFLLTSIEKFIGEEAVLRLIEDNDVIYVVCSTGGGMGSGTVPALVTMLSSVYPHKLFIPTFTLPSIKESLAAQQHAMEFLHELEENLPDTPYLMYDNDKYAGPQSDVFAKVNADIVKDICVLSGKYNLPTNLSSIDENDMMTIINKPQRIVVGRLEKVQHKEIKSSLAEALRRAIVGSAHADMGDLPAVIPSIGLICNLESKFDEFTTDIVSGLQDEFGDCIEDFAHIRVKPEAENETGNMCHVIMSGIPGPEKRINAIKTKKEELESLMNQTTKTRLAEGVDTNKIAEARLTMERSIGGVSVNRANQKEKVDFSNIMKNFK